MNYQTPEQRKVLSAVADAITQEGTRIEIDIQPRHAFHAALQKFGATRKPADKIDLFMGLKIRQRIARRYPAKRVFVLRPLVLGTLARVSKILFDINIDINPGANQSEQMKQSIGIAAQNTDAIVEALAIALHNRKAKAPAELKRFLMDNLTADEMLRVLYVVIQKLDVNAFISATVLMGSLHVLKISESESETSEKPTAESAPESEESDTTGPSM